MLNLVQKSREIRGVELCYFEQGAPGDSGLESILFLHATGFHARVWDEVIRLLPGRHIIALEFRGHGRSGKQGPYNWNSFGMDLVDFVDALGLDNVIGIGHSLGGRVLVHVAALRSLCFKRLILVDPVIFEPQIYKNRRASSEVINPADHMTARRRNRWADWQEMYERFVVRDPFNLWQQSVLRDYCQYGLLPDDEWPGFKLACPPLVEAEIYATNNTEDVTDVLADIKVPVLVLRAQPREEKNDTRTDFSKSPTRPDLADLFHSGRDVFLPELSHFIPMQNPALVAQFVLDGDAVVD